KLLGDRRGKVGENFVGLEHGERARRIGEHPCDASPPSRQDLQARLEIEFLAGRELQVAPAFRAGLEAEEVKDHATFAECSQPIAPPRASTACSSRSVRVCRYASASRHCRPPPNQTPFARNSGATKSAESATERSRVWTTVTSFAPLRARKLCATYSAPQSSP